nr:hypothetical protein [Streptomyces naganishii]
MTVRPLVLGRGPQAPAILESLATALRTIDPDNAWQTPERSRCGGI